MGNIIATIAVSVFDLGCNIVQWTYDTSDGFLDLVSVYVCMEKPSYDLALNNLHIPAENVPLLTMIFDLLQGAVGLATIPLKKLNDKKFTIHIYETSIAFVTQKMEQSQDIVTLCEKMLIYIAQNRNKIVEPANKQIIKVVNLNNIDYDVPVNFWYTLNIDGTNKVFFFAHVSSVHNYKGIIIAVNKDSEAHHSLLTSMKHSALNYYDQTLGKSNEISNTNRHVNFI